MPYEDDESSEAGPKSSFEVYRAEGDMLFKQGEYKKALESYNLALEMQADDKNTLVSRSKTYLHLGDPEKALEDAESSLKIDREFPKGLFQKAEAFYQMGDFENALIFYHRGHQLRAELHEFRVGIQKAQEAIENSIGDNQKVKLESTGDLTDFYRDEAIYNCYKRKLNWFF